VPQGTEKTGVHFSRPRLRRQGLRTLHLKAASKNVITARGWHHRPNKFKQHNKHRL